MATSKSQRIGIWIIAIVLTIGTVGSFFVMVLANGNAKIDQEKAKKDYLAQLEKMQKEARKANRPLEGYEATPFEKSSISKLNVEILKEGDGPILEKGSTISANYFGWQSNGDIFDSTNKNGTVSPIEFKLSEVIKGWTDGLSGIKVGSIVRLSIPSDQAYGDNDDGPGRPTGPLMFIVEVKELK